MRCRLQHVNLLVDDIAAATRFYRDVVGLEALSPPEQGFVSQFFRFNEQQELHINELPDQKPQRAHFCLVVDDFSAVFRRLKAAGALDVVVWGKIRKLPTGAWQMFARDPAGNLLEFASAPGAILADDVARDPLLTDVVDFVRLPPSA